MKGRPMRPFKSATLLAASLVLAITADAQAFQAAPLPNPVLYMTGQEVYDVRGTTFVRYRYDVFNKDAYPAAML